LFVPKLQVVPDWLHVKPEQQSSPAPPQTGLEAITQTPAFAPLPHVPSEQGVPELRFECVQAFETERHVSAVHSLLSSQSRQTCPEDPHWSSDVPVTHAPPFQQPTQHAPK